jgi:hypothetical protein
MLCRQQETLVCGKPRDVREHFAPLRIYAQKAWGAVEPDTLQVLEYRSAPWAYPTSHRVTDAGDAADIARKLLIRINRRDVVLLRVFAHSPSIA